MRNTILACERVRDLERSVEGQTLRLRLFIEWMQSRDDASQRVFASAIRRLNDARN